MVEVQHKRAVYRTRNGRIMLNINMRAVPSPGYNLTSYAAGWKRVEKDEMKLYKEVRKVEVFRKKKRSKIEGRKKQRFCEKVFP